MVRSRPGNETAKARMIEEFTKNATDAYSRILTRYPMMDRTEDAKARLEALHQPVPKPTKAALAQNKAEEDSRRESQHSFQSDGEFPEAPRRGPGGQSRRAHPGGSGSGERHGSGAGGDPRHDGQRSAPGEKGSVAIETLGKAGAAARPARAAFRHACARDRPSSRAADNPASQLRPLQDPNELKPNMAADPNELKPTWTMPPSLRRPSTQVNEIRARADESAQAAADGKQQARPTDPQRRANDKDVEDRDVFQQAQEKEGPAEGRPLLALSPETRVIVRVRRITGDAALLASQGPLLPTRH